MSLASGRVDFGRKTSVGADEIRFSHFHRPEYIAGQMKIETACSIKPTVIGDVNQGVWLVSAVSQLIDLSTNQMRDGALKADIR